MINHYLELHEYINKNIYKFPVKEDDMILEGINWVKGLAIAGLGALIIWVFNFFIKKNGNGLSIEQQKFLNNEKKLRQQIRELEQKNIEQQNTILDQRKEIDEFKNASVMSGEENKELKTKMQAQQSKFDQTLDKTVDKSNREIEKLTQSNKNLDKQLSKSNMDYDKLKDQHRELKNQHRELKEQNRELDSIKKELTDKISLLEKQLLEAKGDATKQLDIIKQYKADKEELEKKIELEKKERIDAITEIDNLKREYNDKVHNYYGILPDVFKNENLDDLTFTLTNFEKMFKVSWILGINFNFGTLKKNNLLEENEFKYINELDTNIIEPINQFINSTSEQTKDLTFNNPIFKKIFPGIEYNNISMSLLPYLLDDNPNTKSNIIRIIKSFQSRIKDNSYETYVKDIYNYIINKFPSISKENMEELDRIWISINKKYQSKYKSLNIDEDFDWRTKSNTIIISQLGKYLRAISALKIAKQELDNSKFLSYFNTAYNK